MKIKFVAEIQNPCTLKAEYEIVSENPVKIISVLLLLKHEAGFSLTTEKLLNHLFVGGPNGTGAAYCERNVCITVRSEP